MPTTIIDDGSSFPSTVQVPAAGEPRTAASVLGPFQQLANRTANLLSRLNSIFGVGDNGVGRIKSVTGFGALQGLTPPADGGVCRVIGSGIYEYVASSTANTPDFRVIEPNNGVGRWFLVQAAVGNRLVDIKSSQGAQAGGNFVLVTGSGYTQTAIQTAYTDCIQGDILDVSVSLQVDGACAVALRTIDNGVTSQQSRADATGAYPVTIGGTYTVTSPTPIIAVLLAPVDTAHGVNILNGWTMTVRRYRP